MYYKPPKHPAPAQPGLPPRAHSLGSGVKPGPFDAAVEEIQQLAHHSHHTHHDSPAGPLASLADRRHEGDRAAVLTPGARGSVLGAAGAEEEEGEVESVSSSASLPRVARGAASFAAKDIGDSGMKVSRALRSLFFLLTLFFFSCSVTLSWLSRLTHSLPTKNKLTHTHTLTSSSSRGSGTHRPSPTTATPRCHLLSPLASPLSLSPFFPIHFPPT